MDVKFKFEKYRDFNVIGAKNSPSPIDFACGPYRSAALPVITSIFHQLMLIVIN